MAGIVDIPVAPDKTWRARLTHYDLAAKSQSSWRAVRCSVTKNRTSSFESQISCRGPSRIRTPARSMTCRLSLGRLDDQCRELELTICLSMLQLAGHIVRYSPSAQPIRNSRYRVLLATAPGEKHMLGTIMLADQFLAAGWQVDMAFPESDEALTNQMNTQHPDAVDIGLSDAMPRQHAIDQLSSTTEHSRHIVSEHPTVISVGGRLFAEAAATALSVGADYARKGLAGTSVRLAELVRQSRAG